MSGHSKWATIHRQKGIKDAARGKLFSKLGAAISIAVKTGGGPSPDSNLTLRMAIDKARAANMPKDNIDRAISRASEVGMMDEVTYEGFGPYGVSVMINVATDNRNRTGQEIKNMLEKAGGRLAGPGSVSFNFDPVGFILVEKKENTDEQLLTLIDLGANDVVESEDGIECYVAPASLFEMKKKIEAALMTAITSELLSRPKTLQKVEGEANINKLTAFLETLEDHDDVQKVATNADF